MPTHLPTRQLTIRETLSGVLKLAKEYFLHSNDRYMALLLLTGIILSVIALIGIGVTFGVWGDVFWSALTGMNYPLFIESTQVFCGLIGAWVCVDVLSDRLVQILALNWRDWLTDRLLDKYMARIPNNYVELSRHSNQLDNPGQRIQEDVRLFTEQIFSLGIKLFTSTVNLLFYIGVLWAVGGALSFSVLGASITIPGYMVWAALLYAVVSSGLTHYLGSALKALTHEQEMCEADFRKNLDLVNRDAEGIAQEHGEVYFKTTLKSKFQAIRDNTMRMIITKNKLTAFQSFYTQVSFILPYLIAAPLYFIGRITTAQMMQSTFAFFQVQGALSWFLTSYEDLVRCRTSIDRVILLEQALEANGLVTSLRAIHIEHCESQSLTVRSLNITYSSSTEYMMREFNLTLKSGEHTLIKGRSGFGKSTLLKVFSGSFRYGQGDVFVANERDMFFLPQSPTIPYDTLKAVLAYPLPQDTYTDEEYKEVLQLVGNMEKLKNELNTKEPPWATTLSGGEKLKIGFARALLTKPKWLFLDEAIAAIDFESGQHLYGLLKERLKGITTFISIAHTDTVDKFHDRIVTLERDESGRATIREDGVACNDDNTELFQKRY